MAQTNARNENLLDTHFQPDIEKKRKLSSVHLSIFRGDTDTSKNSQGGSSFTGKCLQLIVMLLYLAPIRIILYTLFVPHGPKTLLKPSLTSLLLKYVVLLSFCRMLSIMACLAISYLASLHYSLRILKESMQKIYSFKKKKFRAQLLYVVMKRYTHAEIVVTVGGRFISNVVCHLVVVMGLGVGLVFILRKMSPGTIAYFYGRVAFMGIFLISRNVVGYLGKINTCSVELIWAWMALSGSGEVKEDSKWAKKSGSKKYFKRVMAAIRPIKVYVGFRGANFLWGERNTEVKWWHGNCWVVIGVSIFIRS